jgi:hypothetical protein
MIRPAVIIEAREVTLAIHDIGRRTISSALCAGSVVLVALLIVSLKIAYIVVLLRKAAVVSLLLTVVVVIVSCLDVAVGVAGTVPHFGKAVSRAILAVSVLAATLRFVVYVAARLADTISSEV